MAETASKDYVRGLPRKTKQPFRKAFEYAPLGFALVSFGKRRTRIVEANRALSAITGLRRRKLRGLDFEDLIESADRDSDREQRRMLLSGELDSYSLQRRMLHEAGDMLWCQVTASLIPAKGGRPSAGSSRSRTSASAGTSSSACATWPTTTR